MATTTVIIPARNEQATIPFIVTTFKRHPETESNIFVAVDADTVDETPDYAWASGAMPLYTEARGKGQVVSRAKQILRNAGALKNRVILCDGDYLGLTMAHISHILADKDGMTIGVPDWPDIDVPERVILSWPHVSGFRCLPSDLIPENGHGYMLETQINVEAAKREMPVRTIFMIGLKSPMDWPLSEQRLAEMKRDQEWGRENGYLG